MEDLINEVGKIFEQENKSSFTSTNTSGTWTYPWIDYDVCDCDNRCPKCGKKKRNIVEP